MRVWRRAQVASTLSPSKSAIACTVARIAKGSISTTLGHRVAARRASSSPPRASTRAGRESFAFSALHLSKLGCTEIVLKISGTSLPRVAAKAAKAFLACSAGTSNTFGFCRITARIGWSPPETEASSLKVFCRSWAFPQSRQLILSSSPNAASKIGRSSTNCLVFFCCLGLSHSEESGMFFVGIPRSSKEITLAPLSNVRSRMVEMSPFFTLAYRWRFARTLPPVSLGAEIERVMLSSPGVMSAREVDLVPHAPACIAVTPSGCCFTVCRPMGRIPIAFWVSAPATGRCRAVV
mmetsp:Transcript_44021/g.116415  ORF Transcript_44021/g.116415 Transcript_44021/m.116415 type:complete len:294 (-) Transcript_44021:45-926(-)